MRGGVIAVIADRSPGTTTPCCVPRHGSPRNRYSWVQCLARRSLTHASSDAATNSTARRGDVLGIAALARMAAVQTVFKSHNFCRRTAPVAACGGCGATTEVVRIEGRRHDGWDALIHWRGQAIHLFVACVVNDDGSVSTVVVIAVLTVLLCIQTSAVRVRTAARAAAVLPGHGGRARRRWQVTTQCCTRFRSTTRLRVPPMLLPLFLVERRRLRRGAHILRRRRGGDGGDGGAVLRGGRCVQAAQRRRHGERGPVASMLWTL